MFFFFNDTATTEIYTLSLHDALPISDCDGPNPSPSGPLPGSRRRQTRDGRSHVPPETFPRCMGDRKSTRLNSSHGYISYAVFCLKKKKPHASVSCAGAKRGCGRAAGS